MIDIIKNSNISVYEVFKTFDKDGDGNIEKSEMI